MTVKVTQPSINLREKINELETKKPLGYVPAFRAYSTGTYTMSTGDQSLSSMLVSVPLNSGGHFESGVFTAPASGIYHFTFTAAANYSSGYLYSYIFVNGSNPPAAYAQYFQQYNVVTLPLTIELSAGDRVTPYISSNYSGGSVSQMIFNGHYVG